MAGLRIGSDSNHHSISKLLYFNSYVVSLIKALYLNLPMIGDWPKILWIFITVDEGWYPRICIVINLVVNYKSIFWAPPWLIIAVYLNICGFNLWLQIASRNIPPVRSADLSQPLIQKCFDGSQINLQPLNQQAFRNTPIKSFLEFLPASKWIVLTWWNVLVPDDSNSRKI